MTIKFICKNKDPEKPKQIRKVRTYYENLLKQYIIDTALVK